MQTLDPQTPVGELAAGQARVWSVLEHFGIDYCCGGRKALATACAEKGLDVGKVIGELTRALKEPPTGPDMLAMTMSELIEYIVTRHHAYLCQELPKLKLRMGRVAEVHGQAHPEVLALARVLRRFADDMYDHMDKEENILFPAIREMEIQGEPMYLEAPMSVMEEEHTAAEADLREMRKLTSGFRPPSGACNTFQALYQGLSDLEKDMHRHVHIENNVLFPRARSFGA